ncbi:MAG: hypothetical protein SPK50_04300 [Mobiluncus porci]|uniref:hypothetical protein n=1 Tax=Mobiluncus TaxID=2050 RepID=UPI0023F4350C|nr:MULTISPECIES: hypothetical protein [Mobiluncus]MCI6583716.1 hypothetical protein [Mobiluncus sp.]MDD7540776.1 hypothetical protein [Mobiluncus porci]MDY5748338.1 hypothetical protein [Mobiluncus porci]
MSERSFEEMLHEIETADGGLGPDPVGESFSGEGLQALVKAARIRDAAQAEIAHAVEVARSEGATWQVIGDILGVTRAAAHKRYSRQVA